MRKMTAILILILLLSSILTGCSEKTDMNVSISKPIGDVTLEEIRKTVEGAGYKVSDEHMGSFLQDVKAGFSVQIVADDKDIWYSILECTSEEAALKNAKTIDEAGRSIAIRNGKIISFYNVEDKEGKGKEILASIVEGKPMAKK